MLKNKKKNDSFIGLIIGSIFIVFFIGLTYFQNYKQSQIKKYEKKVIGKVIEMNYGTRFNLKYEYIVNRKRYEGSAGIDRFKCDDGTEFCIGKKFYVYYSSRNPKYSRIYLGKYEKYKRGF